MYFYKYWTDFLMSFCVAEETRSRANQILWSVLRMRACVNPIWGLKFHFSFLLELCQNFQIIERKSQGTLWSFSLSYYPRTSHKRGNVALQKHCFRETENAVFVSLLDIVFLDQMFAWLRAEETMLAEIQDVCRYQNNWRQLFLQCVTLSVTLISKRENYVV